MDGQEIQMITGILQTILAAIACALAWIIPKRIMWEQTYSSLIHDYRSYDFAVAVQGIVEFFSVECENKIENIPAKYKERFLNDIYDSKDTDSKDIKSKDSDSKDSKSKDSKINADDIHTMKDVRDKVKIPERDKKISPDACLHYQRRLLAQYFYQLDLCARSIFIGKRRVTKDFTQGEAHLIRILFLIDNAIDESEILKKDISCDFRMPRHEHIRGMNTYLSHIYSVIRKSKPYMEV